MARIKLLYCVDLGQNFHKLSHYWMLYFIVSDFALKNNRVFL